MGERRCVNKAMCVPPLTHWQARALEEPCWHHDGAGMAAESKQLPRFSFGGSFCLSLQFFGPFSPSSPPLACPPCSFPVPSFLKGISRCTYTSLVFLLPFSLPWLLPVLVQRHHFMFLSCSFPFPHESLGKVVLGIYRDDILYIYEFVEINHLSYFATVLSI